MRSLSTLLAVCVLLSAGVSAAETTEVAKAALNSLQRLAVRKEADPKLEKRKLEGLHKLGFESQEEVLAAEVTDGVRVYMVRLDKLREYVPGSTPAAELLTPVDSQIYPLRVGRELKSAVLLDRGELSGYGSPRLIRQLQLIRTPLVEQTNLPESAFFLVRVPALNLAFLAHYQTRRSFTWGLAPSRSTAKIADMTTLASDRTLLFNQPKLVSKRELMLTSLYDQRLPYDGRKEAYIEIPQGKTAEAAVVFRSLVQPARNLDVTVPR